MRETDKEIKRLTKQYRGLPVKHADWAMFKPYLERLVMLAQLEGIGKLRLLQDKYEQEYSISEIKSKVKGK